MRECGEVIDRGTLDEGLVVTVRATVRAPHDNRWTGGVLMWLDVNLCLAVLCTLHGPGDLWRT